MSLLLFPEQLEWLAKVCNALNEVDGADQKCGLALQARIAVADETNTDLVLGYIVDEIGGAWSFVAAS